MALLAQWTRQRPWLAAGIAGNIFLSASQQFTKGQNTNLKDLVLSQSNMLRFVKHLSQMRGAAMKVGQLLSLEVGDCLLYTSPSPRDRG